MPTYTQDGRFMGVKTALDKDVMLLDTFEGTEALSRMFKFKLGMYAESETPIKFEEVLGQPVTVTFQKEPKRYFHGIISRLTQGRRTKGANETAVLVRYEAEMVPKLWLLTKHFRSRIFQQKSIPDILKEVLKGLDVAWETQGEYKPRDYCVQYRESDFDFASRLMEEEGIYYYFKHSETAHKMVVADTPQSHVDVINKATIEYMEVSGGRDDERIDTWLKSQEIRTPKQSLRDHCFEMPDDTLDAEEPITETLQVGKETHKHKTSVNAELEHYDFPGRYAQRFDGIDPGGAEQAANLDGIFEDNKRTAKIRIQEEAWQGLVIAATCDCRNLSAGHKFTLEKHFNADGAYLLTEVKHKATIEGTYAQMSVERKEPVYACSFQCIPSAVPFRPQRRTPQARVNGTQTAFVVGPTGDEIFTDKYGRVKVQFVWHREGTLDENSSCWIRVASHWGGKNWGMIHIPRIGEEVVVAFLEGDPDQPIIVGSVYNADHVVPYALPDNKTQSGLISRSSPGGDAETFNQLRFEDKKDAEVVYFHAQKDYTLVVENNQDIKVGKDGADDGSQTLEVYKNRTETVKTGDDTVTIETGKHTFTVKGDHALTVQSGNHTIKIEAGSTTHEAATSIELKVGESSIKIDTSSITIKAATVTVEGTGKAEVKSPATTVKGDTTLTLSGGMVKIN